MKEAIKFDDLQQTVWERQQATNNCQDDNGLFGNLTEQSPPKKRQLDIRVPEEPRSPLNKDDFAFPKRPFATPVCRNHPGGDAIPVALNPVGMSAENDDELMEDTFNSQDTTIVATQDSESSTKKQLEFSEMRQEGLSFSGKIPLRIERHLLYSNDEIEEMNRQSDVEIDINQPFAIRTPDFSDSDESINLGSVHLRRRSIATSSDDGMNAETNQSESPQQLNLPRTYNTITPQSDPTDSISDGQ